MLKENSRTFFLLRKFSSNNSEKHNKLDLNSSLIIKKFENLDHNTFSRKQGSREA